MRSIERRFRRAEKRFPNSSSFICFGRAVMGQKFSPRLIAQYMKKLVESDDYSPKDRLKLQRHFVSLTEMPEENIKWRSIGS